MKEISLSDNEIKNITVYDTSGSYSDPKIKHDYESGLIKLRESWINNRVGIVRSEKQKLRFLNYSKNVEPFPNINNKIFKKRKIMKLLSYFTREIILSLRRWGFAQ